MHAFSRSFDEWSLAEEDLRAFLQLGLAMSDEGYRSRWDAIGRLPSDGEGPEMIDLFDREVGINQLDFNWLLANLCIRDGVTLYETYLEKGLEEVYVHQVGRHEVSTRSPNAGQIRDVYRDVLAVDTRPTPVDQVIALRDLLTHRRGELRTEELRERYDTEEYGLPDLNVRLPPAVVADALDALRSSVVTIDRAVLHWGWGTERLPVQKHDLLLRKTAKWLHPPNG